MTSMEKDVDENDSLTGPATELQYEETVTDGKTGTAPISEPLYASYSAPAEPSEGDTDRSHTLQCHGALLGATYKVGIWS
ncbi:hypothetical protein NDU88_000032 [Pleurodeles waltl]|uniref:Uncharacterized protein n=1 Tax=Pleurodeles waltl TaxID=8319 RepID=A0AAV7VVL0_PLEWA|nr:hypothetical protein NDU88_000032 [Pleurodeles waltl]